MTSARPRQCVGSLRWISFFLLLASTIVESQVQTTVEVVTETGVATERMFIPPLPLPSYVCLISPVA